MSNLVCEFRTSNTIGELFCKAQGVSNEMPRCSCVIELTCPYVWIGRNKENDIKIYPHRISI